MGGCIAPAILHEPRCGHRAGTRQSTRRASDAARQAQAASAESSQHHHGLRRRDDDTPFIVSELVRASLRGCWSTPLAIREVLDLGVQMAEGPAAAPGGIVAAISSRRTS
jgi:hypothetical protein